MFNNSTLRNAVLLSLYGAAALTLTPSAFAQSAPEAKSDSSLQSVSIVGSRRATT